MRTRHIVVSCLSAGLVLFGCEDGGGVQKPAQGPEIIPAPDAATPAQEPDAAGGDKLQGMPDAAEIEACRKVEAQRAPRAPRS